MIQKISLDDPSKIVYDHCLVTKSCGNHPSPTVRLFRSKGIAFADLPSQKATLLTVETLDTANQWHSYIFPVTTSNAPATYNKVVIGDAPSPNRSRFRSSLVRKPDVGNSSYSQTPYAVTALGMRQAEQKQLLVDPQLKGRVQTYLRLTQAGMSDKLAATKAGVSLDLVQHLQALGQQRMDELTAQQKAADLARVAQAVKASNQLTAQSDTAVNPQPVEQPKKHRKVKRKVESAQLPPDVSPDSKVVQTPTGEAINYKPVAEPIWGNASHVGGAESPKVPPERIALASATTEPTAAKSQSHPTLTPKILSKQDYATALLRGLNKARLDGKIRYGSNKWNLVNDAIRLLRRGSSLDKAIAASGMERDGFMQLLSDGGLVS